MENEDLGRPFHFIVTGQYLAVHYDGNSFVLHMDLHVRGSLFYLSDDNDKIIHNRTYIGSLSSHPGYRGDVFYIRRGPQYLSEGGLWTDSIGDAVKVQIDPELDHNNDDDDDVSLVPPLSNPVVSAANPISADGIDLYHPEKWFALYPITGDCLWSGDASNFESKLVFGGNPYSIGMPFQLTNNDGKTRIRSYDGRFLTVMIEPEVAEYLKEECRQHNALSRCPRCMNCYTVGFHPEPQDCFTLIPRGLPSMFVLYDGAFYYRAKVLKAGYAMLERKEQIEDASLFQFVG